MLDIPKIISCDVILSRYLTISGAFGDFGSLASGVTGFDLSTKKNSAKNLKIVNFLCNDGMITYDC